MAGNRPDTGDVHVNALLSNISIGYRNDSYVADKVFPLVPVNKQADIIPVYNKSDWLRDDMQVRAPGTEAAEAGWSVTNTATYFAKNFALAKKIPDEVRENADAPYDMDRDATIFVTEKAMIRREVEFAAKVNAASIWTTNTTVGVKWSDFANSDPVNDIKTGSRTITQLIARKPNVLVIGQLVLDRLTEHPDFQEKIKYTQTSVVTEDLIAKLLNLEAVYTCYAIYESAAEGGTSSIVAIWDDDAVLLYVPKSPSLFTPAAGYTFYWKPLTGGGPQYIRKYRVDSKKTDVVEVQSYFDCKVTSADAAVRWADCVD